MGKADLCKGYCNPKRKLGVSTYFQRELNKNNSINLIKKPYNINLIKYITMYGVKVINFRATER